MKVVHRVNVSSILLDLPLQDIVQYVCYVFIHMLQLVGIHIFCRRCLGMSEAVADLDDIDTL